MILSFEPRTVAFLEIDMRREVPPLGTVRLGVEAFLEKAREKIPRKKPDATIPLIDFR